MGKRGPRKTPESVLEARGSRLPSRPDRTGVALSNELPVIVSTDPDVERAAGRILDNIESIGWASPHHADGVLHLARLGVEVEKARRRMDEFIVDYSDSDSVYAFDVLVKQYARLSDSYGKWCREFAMTPAAVADMPKTNIRPKQVKNEPAKAPIKRGL